MVLTSKRLILYFNPRSHERSDCYSNISLTFSSYFNPRSHERSDATTLRQGIYRLNFNPRSHERSDTTRQDGRAPAKSFQSTLPREERPVSPIFDLQTSHFNPRSHERSDTPIAIPTTPAQFQSTLPREERLSNVDFKSIPYISIHAPTRGATLLCSPFCSAILYFNPRSHERSDKICVMAREKS